MVNYDAIVKGNNAAAFVVRDDTDLFVVARTRLTQVFSVYEV